MTGLARRDAAGDHRAPVVLGILRPPDPDHRDARRVPAGGEQRAQSGQQEAPGEVAAATQDDEDDVAVGFGRVGLAHGAGLLRSVDMPAPQCARTPARAAGIRGGVGGVVQGMSLPLSVLDLALVRSDSSVGEALCDSVTLAQAAERLGYERVWYAEHHNFAGIASAAPSVIIANVAAQTERIRLGSGGVMLPNHSPLVIAEQFGTLAELHPGRIDLGLGRAPGTDPHTLTALRRDPSAAERFPADVRELRHYLGDAPSIGGITAVPGRGTKVPLYILGSSLFGAQLAAAFGLPYAFASHFAPAALEQATAVYRDRFEPSEQLAEPYVIAAVNVVAHDDAELARAEFETMRRERVRRFAARGRALSDAELDQMIASGAADQILDMVRYSAVGDGPVVRDYLEDFAGLAGADELMVAAGDSSTELALDSLEVLRRAWDG